MGSAGSIGKRWVMKDRGEYGPPTELTDRGLDALSHPQRTDKVYILTLDTILATDIYERIHFDPRMQSYEIVRPIHIGIKDAIEEIQSLTRDTIAARLLIFDVRKDTHSLLMKAYNEIVGYNRRDFNKYCYVIVIGDGPASLFQPGTSLDVFVPHLAKLRIDYHPAAIFYDPFLHYEPNELERRGIDDAFTLPDKAPQRFQRYFQKTGDVSVSEIRRFFRATHKSPDVKKERDKILRKLYRKRIRKQFSLPRNRLRYWLSKAGLRLATEKLHLYPLYFEDWAYELVQRARKPY